MHLAYDFFRKNTRKRQTKRSAFLKKIIEPIGFPACHARLHLDELEVGG